MIKRYDNEWEIIYDKKMNLTEEDKQRAKDKNSFIFNYIIDDLGFKIGVVVAQKREEDVAPYIGWALFSEISEDPNVSIESFYEIPKFQEYLTSQCAATMSKHRPIYNIISDLKNYNYYDDTLLHRDAYQVYHIPSKYYRDYVLNIALSRAIPYNDENRNNYFCPYECNADKSYDGDGKQWTKGRILFSYEPSHATNLMQERVELKRLSNMGELNFNRAMENNYYERICVLIRHAIRKMEFRAWKYYKESF